MSNLYRTGPSYQDLSQPTFSPTARDETHRRSFLNLNQPLTSIGRRQPSQIQTPAPNLYLPQPTFSPTYDPATQNFQVASRQQFNRSAEIHDPHCEGDRFRIQQPTGGIAYYVADTFSDTPLARGDWDFGSPPVSDPSMCGSVSVQYYSSSEGSVELLGFPCEDQLAAYDAFGKPRYSAVDLPPYHSQHPPISPAQHSSYSELSANVLFLSELRHAESNSKISKTPITPSEPNTQHTSTKAKRKERPSSSDSDLDMDFKPHFPSSSRRRSAPAPGKQKVASVPPPRQSTAPLPKPHAPKKDGEQKRLSLACLFCRERKIACGRPSEDEPDQTCAQCLRRDLTCEYPKESRRGQHKRVPKEKPGIDEH
ncbi:uncharacterized protein LACBIDRAFT_303137 [Laccaria bicolor S238N-H82]|uniref:Predicted protein n=1 Tax=Laccaria bicolor (strain S238N-H82 / ATCC MYA-4686) TaxID=486041 RepID=B0DJ05_LACBS|nr:uncharacterized protein LACBIDRAFT_303137 [Laccaria bicolor S238N-H82]EDR05434.1 predicted protein [Laccaria bicolor S238N-H82]|eukprot:XP_001883992.1 predicted protein [Laccaria bicolor S238N-H82]